MMRQVVKFFIESLYNKICESEQREKIDNLKWSYHELNNAVNTMKRVVEQANNDLRNRISKIEEGLSFNELDIVTSRKNNCKCKELKKEIDKIMERFNEEIIDLKENIESIRYLNEEKNENL